MPGALPVALPTPPTPLAVMTVSVAEPVVLVPSVPGDEKAMLDSAVLVFVLVLVLVLALVLAAVVVLASATVIATALLLLPDPVLPAEVAQLAHADVSSVSEAVRAVAEGTGVSVSVQEPMVLPMAVWTVLLPGTGVALLGALGAEPYSDVDADVGLGIVEAVAEEDAVTRCTELMVMPSRPKSPVGLGMEVIAWFTWSKLVCDEAEDSIVGVDADVVEDVAESADEDEDEEEEEGKSRASVDGIEDRVSLDSAACSDVTVERGPSIVLVIVVVAVLVIVLVLVLCLGALLWSPASRA